MFVHSDQKTKTTSAAMFAITMLAHCVVTKCATEFHNNNCLRTSHVGVNLCCIVICEVIVVINSITM